MEQFQQNSYRNAIAIILIAYIAFACNMEPTEISQVSLNLKESKFKKVFISEFEIIHIETFNKYNSFPIKSVWEEKSWEKINRRYSHEFRIEDSSATRLVFELNAHDTFFTEPNYIEGKWLISMDSTNSYVGSTRGMLNCQLNNKIDSIAYFTIYKLNSPTEININRIPLFNFAIRKLI